MDYNAYIFIFGHEKNKVANALLDTKIHNIQYISSVSVFVPIWLWGSSKKWPHSSTVTVLLLLRSVAKENSPKKLGNIFWGVNNWWCFLFTEKSQTSERKGPSLPGKKWESVLWMIFGFVSFQLQKIEFLVLYLTSWISPLGGPFRWGTSWDKDK